MKTYLKDSMQGMLCMRQMMCMQCMCQMMCMHNMCPMMNMQGMPQMEGTEMSQMMDVKGMYPMMGMDKQNDNRPFPIPMLAKLQQTSKNQIQISYDRDVDMRLGMKPTNYWMQDTMNVIPKGIATLGRNDKVNLGNSLTGNMVKINSVNGSARTFMLTFNRAITGGAQYKLIICYVTVKGAPPYSGDNGMASFIGK